MNVVEIICRVFCFAAREALIFFFFNRNMFANVLSILKTLSKSSRIQCSLSRLVYFAI